MNRTDDSTGRYVVDDLTELVVRFLPDGTVTFANEAYARFFGRTREAFEGQRWFPRAHAEDLPVIMAGLGEMTPEHPVVVIENRVYDAAGEVRWMQFVNRAFFDSTGTLLETQAVARDITDRRRMEEDLRRHQHRMLELEEELRHKIARELHDEVGTHLAALALHLSVIEQGLSKDSRDRLGSRFEDCERLLDHVSRTVRNLQTLLRPPVLDDYGLSAALRWQADLLAGGVGLIVDVRSAEDFPRLERDVEVALFRIAQEALSNVLKHAAATHVEVTLEAGEAGIRLAVADNGRGFEPGPRDDGARAGWGLSTMRERVEALGGVLTIETGAGRGTRVIALVRGVR